MTDLRRDCIEAGADAMMELPYDTLELRNWGHDSVADPASILSAAAFDAVVSVLSSRADEAPGHSFESWTVADLLAVLRGDE